MRLIRFSFVFFLFLGYLVPTAFAQKGDALKHARAGYDYEQKQQYPQALYEYNAAIKEDPAYPYPLTRIGGMYQILKNYPLAIQFYERSVKLDSAFDVYNYFNLGLCFRIVEKHDSAALAMQEFLRRMEPINADDSSHMRDADWWIKFNLGCIAERAKPKNTENPVPLTDINSKYDDFGVSVTADGQTLYFTSRRKGTNTKLVEETEDYGDDLFVSHRDTSGHWAKAVPLPSPLNSIDDEGAATVSADGQTLYFSLCRRPDGVGDCDLYFSELIGDTWTKPQNFGLSVNTPAWDAQPCVTADGSTMYFSSRRAGSMDGSEDIYVAYRNTDGTWTKPQNLGEPINTRFNERSPFIAADGKTLYFSSNGHPGYGNHDLFLSKKLPDGTWSVPINLGSPINEYGDEAFLTIPATGDRIYYASQRTNPRGDLDLFEAKLPVKFRPGPVTVIAGTVYDAKTHEPVGAKIEVNDLKADQLVAVYRANKVTGKFYLTLGTGKEYSITATAPGYVFYSDTSIVPDTISYRELTHDLPLQRLPDYVETQTKELNPPSNGTSNTGQNPSTNPATNTHENPPTKGTTGHTKNPPAKGSTGHGKNPPPTKGTTGNKKNPPNQGKTPPSNGSKTPSTGEKNLPPYVPADTTTMELNNLFFDFNKATLRPESRPELRYLTDLLKTHPSYRIEIDGHTDSVGTAEFNMKLSLARAEAVRTYLIQNGIAAERLTTKGYGATKPRATNSTDVGRQKNRRTEFRFLTGTPRTKISAHIKGTATPVQIDRLIVPKKKPKK